jgi:hypothetical protein
MHTHIARQQAVDAAQWDGAETAANLIDSLVGQGRFRILAQEDLPCTEDMEATAEILAGPHSRWTLLCPGDWVIRAASGHISRMRPNTFEETYQAIPDLDSEEVEELAENIADALGSVVSSGRDAEPEPVRERFRRAARSALNVIGDGDTQ